MNNVVLYNALFDVPNPSSELMTQMTAQVFFVLAAAKERAGGADGGPAPGASRGEGEGTAGPPAAAFVARRRVPKPTAPSRSAR